MYCKDCGTQIGDDAVFCQNCGMVLADKENVTPINHVASTTIIDPIVSENSWGLGKIVKTILIVLAVCVAVFFKFFNFLNNEAVDKNNSALTSYDSGNSDQAISQFKQASNDALSNDTKRATLINLAYVYSSESKNDLALKTFKEALVLSSENSFDYNLISGEIALLNKNPKVAKASFEKAYAINPNEFQINNALALFYMDLEDIAPQFVDYKKALVYAQKGYELSKMEISKQNLAIAYFFNDNFNQTISLLSNSDFVKNPDAATWLGMAYLKKEDHVNAKIYFRKAIANGAEVPKEINNYLNSK